MMPGQMYSMGFVGIAVYLLTKGQGLTHSIILSLQAPSGHGSVLLMVRGNTGVQVGAEHFYWFACLANPRAILLRQKCVFRHLRLMTRHGQRGHLSVSRASRRSASHPAPARSSDTRKQFTWPRSIAEKS